VFPDFPSLQFFQTNCDIDIVPFLPPDSWKMELVAQVAANPIERHLAIMDGIDRDAARMIVQEGIDHGILDAQAEESLESNDTMVEEWDESIAMSKEEEQQAKSSQTLAVMSQNLPTAEYSRIGWQIVFSIRRLISQEQWQSKWPCVIDVVFTTGGHIRLDRGAKINAQEEAQWRMMVLSEFQLL
jgi:hypothetical protein